jgi:hypothetical protein
MATQPLEIICSACGRESLLRREPVYDGFAKVGERLSCMSCGHVFQNESEIVYKNRQKPGIFGDADKPRAVRLFGPDETPSKPRVFEQGENKRLCRYCAHYVVNPFVQRCALLRREVEATDTCEHFTAAEKSPKKD